MAASLCIKCGQKRKKDTEKTIFVNSQKTKLTKYVCPDKECQKIVEAQLAEKEERRTRFANRRAQHPPRKKAT